MVLGFVLFLVLSQFCLRYGEDSMLADNEGFRNVIYIHPVRRVDSIIHSVIAAVALR